MNIKETKRNEKKREKKYDFVEAQTAIQQRPNRVLQQRDSTGWIKKRKIK